MTPDRDPREKISWPSDYDAAKLVQVSLQKLVRIKPFRDSIRFIAGVDAAFSGDRIIGAAALYEYPSLIPHEDVYSVEIASFPYIPGLLSFREGPAIMKALAKLNVRPDMVLFDGQGIAHPRGLGIASHIGVLLGIPTIGCAKSRLVGKYSEPHVRKGSCSPLRYKGMTVGAVLRTRSHVLPVFVSPGHLVDIDTSVQVVLGCTGKYRIPEPMRRADMFSKKLKENISFCRGKDERGCCQIQNIREKNTDPSNSPLTGEGKTQQVR
jgi:deoxyribonuclease V